MHETAYQNCQTFYDKYCKGVVNESSIVVDFGSYDVNGTLKPIFKDCKYIGLDMAEGPNVDIVCNVNEGVPLEDNYADVVVSSSCFEHDMFFWESFLEMCRVVKPGGFIYINVPSATGYHAFPIDCWRFYYDAWIALEAYGLKKGYNIKLLERYIDQQCGNHNSVGIYQKTT